MQKMQTYRKYYTGHNTINVFRMSDRWNSILICTNEPSIMTFLIGWIGLCVSLTNSVLTIDTSRRQSHARSTHATLRVLSNKQQFDITTVALISSPLFPQPLF